MPIDRNHAFGNGLSGERPSAYEGVLWRLLSPLSVRASIRDKIGRAWSQFDRGALVSGHCRLGPHAWCTNTSGDPARIRLEEGVVCRGLIRVEQFGMGRVRIHSHAYIGDDVLISCADEVDIGSHALIAHGVQIFDNNTHPTGWKDRQQDWCLISGGKPGPRPVIATAPVRIGSHAWIGFNGVIMKGVTIGERSIVAAGSVVTADVPPDTTVGGNPARILRRREQQEAPW